MAKILVTGGAGFIGTRLVEALLEKGHSVRVIDNLNPQVHGENAKEPEYSEKIDFIHGDIRDTGKLASALEGIEVVFHLAAETGVGQSMYKISAYTSTNVLGTANLLDLIMNGKKSNVKKVILSSSRAVYGEGKYECMQCGKIRAKPRSELQLSRKDWEINCPVCEKKAKPLPTDESVFPSPTSIYGITKMEQENLCKCVSESTGKFEVAVLRYFNVFGAGQSLKNPYTGILSIFSTQILNQNTPEIYEDGLESRDFVYIDDVVSANILALEKNIPNCSTINVGTGNPITVMQAAQACVKELGSSLKPKVIGKFRVGDIRHCFAGTKLAEEVLGFKAKISFEDGVKKLVQWLKTQEMPKDNLAKATEELKERKLFK